MKIERSTGILMHITSLPGKYGVGSLGKDACAFADKLARGGVTYWQILPFNPVCRHFGYSPYASTSTFAGNPFFIDIDELKSFSFIDDFFLSGITVIPENDFVDFELVSRLHFDTLRLAYNRFKNQALPGEVKEYNLFCDKNSYWLDDYSLYTALCDHYNNYNWLSWESGISKREPSAIKSWTEKLSDQVGYHKFLQFLFYKQFNSWKNYCNKAGIKIIGDIPIYVNLESADAWANPQIFELHEIDLKPVNIAGVPPDYFSETGQRWGNPLYKWNDKSGKLNDATVEWWIKRIGHIVEMVDILRIDHFRAFESYWSIPSEEKTAIKGEWVPGPNKELFDRVKAKLGDLPLIAEDLGIITPEVENLRDDLEFPGMKILQFAFDGNKKNSYLPHNYRNSNCVVYTGTHDNNTTNGWYYGEEVDRHQRDYIKNYMGIDNDSDFHWHFIKLGMSTVADLFVIPLQDLLGYSDCFRMNTPGTVENNWRWRLKGDRLADYLFDRFRYLNEMYNRIPEKVVEEE